MAYESPAADAWQAYRPWNLSQVKDPELRKFVAHVNTHFQRGDIASDPATAQALIDLNTAHRSSNGSDHSWLDQDVTIGAAVHFLTLQLNSGEIITLFDTDTSLAADSDTRIATQKAVKAYIDALGSGGANLTWTASTKTVASDTGTDAVLTDATVSDSGLMSATDKTAHDQHVGWLDQSVKVADNVTFNRVKTSGFRPGITSESGDYTAVNSDHTILMTSASNQTLTLPDASTRTGQVLVIKKTALGGSVTIDGDDSDLIDGSTTHSLSTRYESIMIQSDGSNWYII